MGLGIKTKYRKFKWWYHYIVKPKEKSGIKVRIPFFTKLKYNRLGFTDLQYTTFDLAHNDYRNYISTKERYRLEKANGRFGFFLGEKVMFERTFGHFVNVPHIHCWVKCGRFIDLDDNEAEVDLIEELKREKLFIAKPTRSVGGGTGIHELEYRDGSFYIDGEQYSENKLIKRVSGLEEYIITKKVSSHEYSRRIYPDSANSMRIITVMDNETNSAEVVLAFHRFGTKRSRHVDNINSGGAFAVIDIETGEMSEAKSMFSPKEIYEVHPDTGTPIKGTAIPDWNRIKDYLIKKHKCFPYYKFFAWDVVLNEAGDIYILEINQGSDLNIQIVKPQRNEKLGQWMRKQEYLDW